MPFIKDERLFFSQYLEELPFKKACIFNGLIRFMYPLTNNYLLDFLCGIWFTITVQRDRAKALDGGQCTL